ncbi:MAG: YbfB/YjiJ family MFS transporter [Streptosporangiales bacterium]|nr:YbfB/YjiJ family MFS transporter [Streptosporangiales bacterium]MBO0892411.1 YbfB/YjiJ family MFS transporter [Acidothermales bacterium]
MTRATRERTRAATRATGSAGPVTLAFGLSLGPFAALGLGRFAYALLLPTMKAQLHWSFAAAGAVNAANAVGYLAGSLGAARVARRFGTRTSFAAGIVATGVSLLACAATSNLFVLLVLRAVTGATGALTFITGAGLLAQAIRTRRVPVDGTLATGVYFAGASAGILATGLALPALLAELPQNLGWRVAWLVMGAASFLVLVVTVRAARTAPEPPAPPAGGDHRWPARRMVPALLAYGLFGAGYIAYMTFVVAYLRSGGLTIVGVAAFWSVLGAAGIAGPFVWTRSLRPFTPPRRAALILAVLAVGAALPLVTATAAVGFVSAVLFGGSFLMVVTVFTEYVRAVLPPHQWTPAIGGFTVAFAAGQCIGPVLAGMLSDTGGGVRLGIAVSAGVLAVGALVGFAERRRQPAP